MRIPGMAVPKDGSMVPPDAPGFWHGDNEEWNTPWDHARPTSGGLGTFL
ncbi:MAG TPA: hypothetical protein VMW65_17570 [Chloroflexota bacterium]|nr:hypothetical protein [Chloroflexota bacterium]